jgi:hypothetical protein
MKLFLDSGAYSAYHNNSSIVLQDYIDFIKENKEAIEVYANLDDISSPEQTWENQDIMEKAGLKPIPVYHLGEPTQFLDRALTYPYFAVGGIASKLTTYGALSIYLDTVFSKICTKKTDFLPSNKIHGFGIATPQLLIRYPWFSADTSSWVQYGRYGIILIPRIVNGTFRYDVPPYTIAVSSRSKAVGNYNKHFRQLAPIMQKVIIKYCEDKGFNMGRTLFKPVTPDYILKENEHWTDRKEKTRVEKIVDKGLCCNGEMRDRLNLIYFLDLEKHQPKWPWSWKHYREQLFS